MGPEPVSLLEVVWLSDAGPLPIESDRFEKLCIRDRTVVLHDWLGEDEILVKREEFFGVGPARALVLRNPARPARILVVGEEGSVLLELDLEVPEGRRVADLPRFPNDVGGMCRLEVFPDPQITLLHWELGILALGPSLQMLWRQDLEWNHSLISLSDDEVWFDLMYESNEIPQRIGEAPWGYSIVDGRELFDGSPPSA